MNEVFRPAENIRINTRNSCLKLSHPFRKTSTRQNGLSYTGPAIWNRIPEILKKIKIWILLNIRWNTTIWMISLIQIYEILVDLIMFLAIIKNIFLFIKQIFLHLCFFFCFFVFCFFCAFVFSASLWLKDHNENKAIRLFCGILTILFFLSLILQLISFFVCC